MTLRAGLGWFWTYFSGLTVWTLMYPVYVLKNFPRLAFSRSLFPIGFWLIVADQALKIWAVTKLQPQGSIPVIRGFFHLTYVENRGAAFGLFQGQTSAFIFIAAITMVVILFYLSNLEEDEEMVAVALALIFAGAVGNLIDRIRLGYVIDYLHFFYQKVHWPVFNLADVVIDVGVGLIVLDLLLEWRREAKRERELAENPGPPEELERDSALAPEEGENAEPSQSDAPHPPASALPPS